MVHAGEVIPLVKGEAERHRDALRTILRHIHMSFPSY
jgi:hypothetical protein